MTRPLAWLMDTNVLSEMMKPSPEPRVAAFLDSIDDKGIGLSSISVWEILNGIGKMDPRRRREDKANRFHALLEELFEDQIIDWTPSHARECARIMEEKRRIGEPLDDHIPDAFLGAVASCHGLTVLTRNVVDFRNIGVDTVDPWSYV